MTSHDQLLADFRSQISSCLQKRDSEWQASRRLIETSRFADTVHRLIERMRTSGVSPTVQNSLLAAMDQGNVRRIQDLSGPELKALTGLPPSKALRALCVYFQLVEAQPSPWQIPSLDSETVSTSSAIIRRLLISF